MGAAAPEVQAQIAKLETALEKAGCANTAKDYLKVVASVGPPCKLSNNAEQAKVLQAQVAALRAKLGADAAVLDGLLEADALLEGLNKGAATFGKQGSGRYVDSVAS